MTKRSPLLLAALLFFCPAAGPVLYAQESIFAAYERGFVRADLPGKLEILRDAATDERAEEFIGRLYDSVLRFSLLNADILRNDPDFIALTILAAQGAGTAGYKPAVSTLWNVFTSFLDASIRVEVVKALSVLGQGNSEVAGNLIRFISAQNDLFRAGVNPDYAALEACITALGDLKDNSAVPALFALMRTNHPDPIPAKAAAALQELPWDDGQYFAEAVRLGDYPDKLAAFNVGINNKTYTDAEKGMIAEAALETVLDSVPGSGEEEKALEDLRYEAVRLIRNLRWARAAPLAIRHFYRLRQDYEAGTDDKERFLEAIACLGALGTADAAYTLTIHLGYFNLRMEQNGKYDDAVVLETIKAIGEIGNRTAYDNLLTVGYLSYPEHIQNAAREALFRLR
jgi:HEAT repeat protein